MNWQDIREKYPDQWVLLNVLEYHLVTRDNKVFEVVDDFEFIKVLVTDEDFEDAFMSSTGTPFSTKHEALEIRVKLKY